MFQMFLERGPYVVRGESLSKMFSGKGLERNSTPFTTGSLSTGPGLDSNPGVQDCCKEPVFIIALNTCS